jgi:dienelactone hydrolase
MPASLPNRLWLALALLLLAHSAALRAQTLPGFNYNSSDNSFTYDDPADPGAVVTGFIRKPSGPAAAGQAVIICHGKGGSAANFNSQHAVNFQAWGYYCIVPQLSHAGAGGGSPDNEGYCPENTRIVRACRKILAATPEVDPARVGMFAHSMGAYFTGGFCGEDPAPYPAIRAAVLGAGGSQSGTGSSSNAVPTAAEVAGITAPLLLFHGTGDSSYPLSQNLKASLDAHAVANRLNLYQGVPHGIFDANQKRDEAYALARAWFSQHGVLAFAGNTAPTITAPATVTISAGVPSASIAITIGDNETAAGSLTVQAFSLDSDVAGSASPPVTPYVGRLQNNQLSIGGSGPNRTLTISPSAGKTGTVEVALVVTDGTAGTGQLAAVTYLQVTIQDASPPPTGNFRPEISWIADQRTASGVAVNNLAFTVSDLETPAASLTVGAVSSDLTLLPANGITLGGSGTNRTISLAPAAGQSGVATVTLTVSDGAKSTATAFTLTAAGTVAGNTAPTISAVAGDAIAAGTVFGPATVIVKDTEQSETALTLTAASSNLTLVPLSGVVVSSTGYGRTVQVTPASGQSGRVTITLTVSDGANSASTAFVLDVLTGNSPPAIAALPGLQTVHLDVAPPPLTFTVSDAETSAANLRVLATSSNTTLLPLAGIVLSGSSASRQLALTPAGGQTGAATVTLSISDGDYTRRAELLFVVTDPAAAAAQFSRPRGVFVLDSVGGTNYTTTFGAAISLRDGNIRSHAFVDGFTLRIAWRDVESDTTPGQYDFTILQNALGKLPSGQRLSLIIVPGQIDRPGEPQYLAATSGVQTWNDGGVTRPTPWDPYMRERRRAMLHAMANAVTGGVALKNDPRLDLLDPYLPGGFTGIRDPNSTPLRNLPGYTRQKLLAAVQDELRTLQDEFPGKFVQLGFWPITDNENATYGGTAAADWLRQQLLTEFNGITRPRIGFFMENLAAKRTGPNLDPYSATPVTGFASQLFAGRDAAWNGFQMLGSWSRPFNDGHVTNTLYGTPNDAMEFAFNTYRAEYYEVYVGDIDNAAFQPAFQRWHDFYATAATTNPASDEDGDGLPLAWEQQHQLAPTLPDSPTGDSDRDGLPLLLEYSFNQSPSTATASAAFPHCAVVFDPADQQTYLHYTYLRRIDAPPISYTVEVSSDLATWDSNPAYFQTVSATPSGDGITEWVTLRVLPAVGAEPLRFLRTKVAPH